MDEAPTKPKRTSDEKHAALILYSGFIVGDWWLRPAPTGQSRHGSHDRNRKRPKLNPKVPFRRSIIDTDPIPRNPAHPEVTFTTGAWELDFYAQVRLLVRHGPLLAAGLLVSPR